MSQRRPRHRGRAIRDRATGAWPADLIERRRLSVPEISYPDTLPISERRDELLAAIRDHQVVIVAGETGSGKSTQLPKLCLEAGRGVEGMIGHTQPRRVAARTIAERVAEELRVELGGAVGYAVRFTDRVSDMTLGKVMTDGILLAEIQHDPTLRRYDTIIVDEAHERSLNIDFLLGYLRQLLPRRPDLHLVVTSATIDTARFAEHFGDAPVIEVTGRTYPVEVRYRPYGPDSSDVPDDDRDQVQAVCDAVDELAEEGPGDVLVFLSGEREIHDTADALRRLERPNTETLPLYARLSAAEQHRIFQPHTGRRVILSTNVAETSLTVPGVRYVVDAGAARISRYSTRLKVQRLPIEPVSRASADQRAGRCGRVAPGVAIRLYSEDDYESRPEFTEPEILRTNLASVILQMTALGLGDVAEFPFLDPPDGRAVRDGVALLEELGALVPDLPAAERELTPLGRRLARMPIDPRLGRMVLEAERHGCVREVMVIAAALSIQDPRERPADAAQAADESHRRFRVEGSDFLSLVALWDHLRERQQALSSSQFRKLCRAEYLNYLRVREWQDLFSQLRQVCSSLGIRVGSEVGHPDRVHQALLSGLLSQIGMRDTSGKAYRGARSANFQLVRASTIAKKPPRWVMAAELVETNRLWARTAAAIQPEWAERLAGHLAKRSYGDPRWDDIRGAAVVSERVMLYGLPLVAGRTVGFDRIDPRGAREMFIRHALVLGEWAARHPFVDQNRRFLDDVRAMGDRVRRIDLVDDEALLAFYDDRVGPDVVSTRHFERWWRDARRADPSLLTLTEEVLRDGASRFPSRRDFPDVWRQGGLDLAVTYRFEPGQPGDGVTVHVPVEILNQVRPDGFDWQVPGFREELVGALLRTLPKEIRRELIPFADTVDEVQRELVADDRRLTEALAELVGRRAGRRVTAAAFDPERIPAHLRVSFSVDDIHGVTLATGHDLPALQRTLAGTVRTAIAVALPTIERRGITSWDMGTLPETVEHERSGHVVRGRPALVDEGDSVAIRIFSSPTIQQLVMRTGVRRLLLLALTPGRPTLDRAATNQVNLAISRLGEPSFDGLRADCVLAAADAVIDAFGDLPWDEERFAALVVAGRTSLSPIAASALRTAGQALVVGASAAGRTERLVAPAVAESVADARAHLHRLLHPGFVTASGVGRLDDVVRYASGVERRLERLTEDIGRDRKRMGEVTPIEDRYWSWRRGLRPSEVTAEVIDLGWQLEELRISVFAQVLGAARGVSATKISRALDQLERS